MKNVLLVAVATVASGIFALSCFRDSDRTSLAVGEDLVIRNQVGHRLLNELGRECIRGGELGNRAPTIADFEWNSVPAEVSPSQFNHGQLSEFAIAGEFPVFIGSRGARSPRLAILAYNPAEKSALILNDTDAFFALELADLSKVIEDDDELFALRAAAGIVQAVDAQDARNGLGVYVPGKVVDVGTVRPGDRGEYSCYVVNSTTRDVMLDAPHTSCGCLSSTFEGGMLPAGGFAELNLSLVVDRRWPGDALAQRLVLNGSGFDAFTVAMRGTVVHPVRAEPGLHSCGTVSADERKISWSTDLHYGEGVTAKVWPILLDRGVVFESVEVGSGMCSLEFTINPQEVELDAVGGFFVKATVIVERGDERRSVEIGAAGRREPWLQSVPTAVYRTGLRGDRIAGQIRIRTSGLRPVAKYETIAWDPSLTLSQMSPDTIKYELEVPTDDQALRTGVTIVANGHVVSVPIVCDADESSQNESVSESLVRQ